MWVSRVLGDDHYKRMIRVTVGVARLGTLTSQKPWVPSTGHNLHPFLANGDVSTWVKNSRVGRKTPNSWIIEWLYIVYCPVQEIFYANRYVTNGLQNYRRLWPLSMCKIFSRHTCCDTGPRFIRSHPKDCLIISPLRQDMGADEKIQPWSLRDWMEFEVCNTVNDMYDCETLLN